MYGWKENLWEGSCDIFSDNISKFGDDKTLISHTCNQNADG